MKFRVVIIFMIMMIGGCRDGNGEQSSAFPSIESAEDLSYWMQESRQDPSNLNIQRAIISYMATSEKPTTLIDYACPIYESCKAAHDKDGQLHVGVYIGQAYLNMNQFDSMFRYFDEVYDIARQKHLEDLQMVIHNSIGIYFIKHDANYNKAVEYFQMALDNARNIKSTGNACIIQSNIATLYFYRNDPLGIDIAKESYDTAKAMGSTYLTFFSSVSCARVLCLTNEYAEALGYLEEAMSLPEFEGREASTYVVYADILVGMQEDEKAEHYYVESLKYLDEGDILAIIYGHLGYGNLLLRHGRYEEAKEVFSKGIDVAEQNRVRESRHHLYKGLSEAYEKMGLGAEALKAKMIYQSQQDSIFNLENEREFSQLRMRYETSKYKEEIQNKESQLVQESRKNYIALLVIIVVFALLALLILLYRKKNRSYRELVKSHQEAIQREKIERERLAAMTANNGNGNGNGSDQKEKEIFSKLEDLMHNRHIYMDKDISIEKLADMLSTNRSYISRVINNYAGMPFSNYINSNRMARAIEVLSDPTNDIPLKMLADDLGYNSISSFYRAFQKETGVPPSKYRDQIRILHRKAKA